MKFGEEPGDEVTSQEGADARQAGRGEKSAEEAGEGAALAEVLEAKWVKQGQRRGELRREEEEN